MKTTGDNPLALQLDTVARFAPKLRAAGVRRLSVGEVVIDLEPVEADASAQTGLDQMIDAKKRQRLHPLNDPITFGRDDGVPGLTPLDE